MDDEFMRRWAKMVKNFNTGVTAVYLTLDKGTYPIFVCSLRKGAGLYLGRAQL